MDHIRVRVELVLSFDVTRQPAQVGTTAIKTDKVNAAVAAMLALNGHYVSQVWNPPPTNCHYIATAEMWPPLPKNLIFAGDSTTGQIEKCFYLKDAEIPEKNPTSSA